MLLRVFFCSCLCFVETVFCQDSVGKKLKLSGYVELFYQYNLNTPSNHQSAAFIYDYVRHNELNPHLLLVRADYDNERVRGRFGIGLGTYMDVNYANEPAAFKNLYEANFGMQLFKNKNVWFDVGILPSHIGAESGMGKSNYNVMRSLMADNTPFYETGLRLYYGTKKWAWSALYLTGWQRIKRIDGNSTPAFGTQIVFTPNEKWSLNSSTFLGSEFADAVARWRYFNDFYVTANLSKSWSAICAFDVGCQEQAGDKINYDVWSSASLMVKKKVNEQLTLACRGEYYDDKKNVIITTIQPVRLTAYSFNADYSPEKSILLRLEGRWIHAEKAIFAKGDEWRNNNVLVTAAFILAL